MPHVVLIETQGNQRYIFATNRLRENAGASELTAQVGTRLVIKAVVDVGETQYADLVGATPEDDPPTGDFVRMLDEIAGANPIGKAAIEIVVATSGKAVLLVDSRETGIKIVRHVTLNALTKLPGATVRGWVSELPLAMNAGAKEAHCRVKEVHQGIDRLRLLSPPPDARYPTLPILRPCRSSGLPSATWLGQAGAADRRPMSEPIGIKSAARPDGTGRIRKALGTAGDKLQENPDKLEKLPWLGVVHADGNGFGKIFLDFGEASKVQSAREYFDKLRRFSISLELCGIAAFAEALKKFPMHEKRQEMVPLVLGGDDLTVVCDGRHAIDFTKNYLEAFARLTEKPKFDGFTNEIPAIAEKQYGRRNLGGAAGVAIVKPHFPFYRAYELAEALLKSAKKVKTEIDESACALDFQTVYEDAAPDLGTLRGRWDVEKEPKKIDRLYARPYVISGGPAKSCWDQHRRFDKFVEAVDALRGTDKDDRPRLPRTQQHALRDALFEGEKIADARLKLIEHRYAGSKEKPGVDWSKIKRGEGPGHLFFSDGKMVKDGVKYDVHSTVFLDALEYIDVSARRQSAEDEAAA